MKPDEIVNSLLLPLVADTAGGHHGWGDGWWAERRLAEGEISSQEYEERRRTLRNAREAPDGGG
jgi:phage gp46-like protein